MIRVALDPDASPTVPLWGRIIVRRFQGDDPILPPECARFDGVVYQMRLFVEDEELPPDGILCEQVRARIRKDILVMLAGLTAGGHFLSGFGVDLETFVAFQPKVPDVHNANARAALVGADIDECIAETRSLVDEPANAQRIELIAALVLERSSLEWVDTVPILFGP